MVVFGLEGVGIRRLQRLNGLRKILRLRFRQFMLSAFLLEQPSPIFAANTEHGKTVSSESSESIDALALSAAFAFFCFCLELGIGAGETAEKPTASV